MGVFGNRLKLLRKSKKLTQKNLADLFQLGESTISMYERDEREPSFELTKKLADYFGVSTDYLLGRENNYTLDRESENESLFFFDKEDITPEEMEELKKYLEFMRMKAKQENEKKD